MPASLTSAGTFVMNLWCINARRPGVPDGCQAGYCKSAVVRLGAELSDRRFDRSQYLPRLHQFFHCVVIRVKGSINLKMLDVLPDHGVRCLRSFAGREFAKIQSRSEERRVGKECRS